MSTPAISPAYFTAVMGTGIVATAAHTLPVHSPVLTGIALTAWVLDVVLFLVIGAITAAHYATDRGAVRRYLLDGASAPFYGAMAMGILSVGTATLLVGSQALGTRVAVDIDLALWVVGTAVGLASATLVPAIAFTRHRVEADGATPLWLLPVVAPMVSAAAGALLIDHVGADAKRNLALACYALFGATAMAALAVTASVWNKLAHHPQLNAATAPALLIVLGPLGQSVTAAGLLADHAPGDLGVSHAGLVAFSVLYGVPTMGFALVWLVIAGMIIADAARKGLPFSLGWWAFTFPIGTCVTGATVLAAHTGSGAIATLAVALYALLLAGWVLAAGGTARMLTRRWAASRAATTAFAGASRVGAPIAG
ncbi:MAG: C4-dicarboxylate ABC transporter [Demequinaceae bacterium]|nr:C4-dicarboxylate ABC transporter [Demequinaceae bacterium]